ncbi:MAG: hypothetical protein AB2A00_20430 [Myxococcota bacterium]
MIGFPPKAPNRPVSMVAPDFKGVRGEEQMVGYLNGAAGGVAFEPLEVASNSLRKDTLPKKAAKGLWGFFMFHVFERAAKPNKFTLWGARNFTGEYPKELVAARQKKA